MKTGVLLLTALVPTIGHQYAVDFAANFMRNADGRLNVIISSRSSEPTTALSRLGALSGSMDHYTRSNTRFHIHADDNAPQNPPEGDQTAFWEYWKNMCEKFDPDGFDFFFASEKYGHKMSEVLNAEFIPVDIAREVMPARGTDVREHLFLDQDKISPAFIKNTLQSTVVLFGPESCGKTTMAKNLSKTFRGDFLHEWARPYLEECGPETTEERMTNIVLGQAAVEQSFANRSQKILIFKDTDLLTTLGFYRLYNMKIDIRIYDLIKELSGDLYIVMNDGIPFEKDILRYGGDKRESNRQFWIDLLEEFNLEYYVVQSIDPMLQMNEITHQILDRLPTKNQSFGKISTFKRD